MEASQKPPSAPCDPLSTSSGEASNPDGGAGLGTVPSVEQPQSENAHSSPNSGAVNTKEPVTADQPEARSNGQTASPPSEHRRRKPFARVALGVRMANFLCLDDRNGRQRSAAFDKEQTDKADATEASRLAGQGREGFPSFKGDLRWSERSWLYELMPFRGMIYDVRRRVPYYWSDWSSTFQPGNLWTVAKTVVTIYFIK